jgi:hypothetical protein
MVWSNGEMWKGIYSVRVHKDKKLIYHRNNLTSEDRSIEVTYFCTYLFVEEQRNRRETNEPPQRNFYHQIFPWNT